MTSRTPSSDLELLSAYTTERRPLSPLPLPFLLTFQTHVLTVLPPEWYLSLAGGSASLWLPAIIVKLPGILHPISSIGQVMFSLLVHLTISYDSAILLQPNQCLFSFASRRTPQWLWNLETRAPLV
ncbi:hypothetical protein AOQ84DRAFT_23268 [Glonium stellatum]|uniref:Uncharacterized protein n=1 Tax=Glonium stellatum TaxID=574774 RepID=A0A8E2F2H2_9PEZI|nr:hypothetical protein AOQ84DRAFT_23268 [Glonium stellatum]